jgi:glycosyltransferase involved in cell wall biosynthesis
MDGYRIIRLNLHFFKYLYGLDPYIYSHIKEILHTYDPDIIHIHGYHTLSTLETIFILKVILKSPIPIIFSPHYGGESHNTFLGKYLWKLYNKLGYKIINYVDKIVCASEYEKNNIIKDLNIKNYDNIEVIPHGVDRISLDRRTRRTKRIHLLYIGYILKLKGVQDIMRAVCEVKYNFRYDVDLTIIGEGDYKKELIKLSDELSISNSLIWYPFQKSDVICAKYKECDIFLLLSKSENYGIVVAEALASGLPCIIANTSALVEFNSIPGCFGVSVPVDPNEVARLIINIYNNDIKTGPFGNKIASWNRIAECYEFLFNELMYQ